MPSESDIYFRDCFREARAKAQRDSEDFQEVLFTLERYGSYLTSKIGDLGKYEDVIEKVACRSPLATNVPSIWRGYHLPFSTLYELVRNARNDALHQGSFARHLTDHAIQLSFIIEDALMDNSNLVSDYMIRAVVRAELWQPVSFVRQQMLANSFTYLPLLAHSSGNAIWYLLSDTGVAKYIHSAQSKEAREERLLKTVEMAISDGLKIDRATHCCLDTPKGEALKIFDGKPILVVDNEQPELLMGMVTAFDLL